MIREDYRRALIMLRSVRRGVSGHVRLERRTLLATLQFAVCGAGEARLQGFLLGRVQRQWRGVALGPFGAPRYGQAGLSVKFDPRNLQGLTLEQYELIGVAEETTEGYRPVLFGNLNGSVECTFERIQEECARLFSRPLPPAAELPQGWTPAEGARTPPEGDTPARKAETDSDEGTQTQADDLDAPARESELDSGEGTQTRADDPDAPAREAEPASEEGAQTRADDPDAPAQEADPASEEGAQTQADDLDAPAREAEPDSGEGAQTRADDLDAPARKAEPDSGEGTQTWADDLDAPAREAEPAFEVRTQTRADDLDAPAREAEPDSEEGAQTRTDDLDAPAREPGTLPRTPLSIRDCEWPESLSELRAFFASEPSEEPFALEGYAFVRAGLACVGGAEYCLIGVRARDGRIDSVCYAVPAQPGETEAPAGLEHYRLQDGYWIYCQPVE